MLFFLTLLVYTVPHIIVFGAVNPGALDETLTQIGTCSVVHIVPGSSPMGSSLGIFFNNDSKSKMQNLG